MTDAGAALQDCLIIEIFAGTARVTACLKQLGMASAFGTDHVRHKQTMAQVVLADLTTKAGVELLMQWLSNPSVLGIFLAPPCGTASRARAIPLKRKRPGDPPAPKPLRSDAFPNGIPGMSFFERMKISKANKLYHLTAQLVRWAAKEGCLICVENPQFSLFWQTTFMQEVMHLLKFTIFQACRYGGTRPKRTMLAFNTEEFLAINKMCTGVSAKHQHDKWGLAGPEQQFATALEAAYPMTLAKTIAATFVQALENRGIRMPPETLSGVRDVDLAMLPALRAKAGLQQPKASKLPPLIPTFASRVALTGYQDELPQYDVQRKVSSDLKVSTFNAPTTLLKGSKLLQVSPSLLPPSCLQKGVFVSGQHLEQHEIDRIIERCASQDSLKPGGCETQVWGVPWTEEQFIQQMVTFGHPSTLQSGIPAALKEVIRKYKETDAHQRISYRASKLGFWLKRMAELKEQEKQLKASMDGDVASVLERKNILLWEAMLNAVEYPDMGVVKEFTRGTDLVGEVEKTGLWPAKFQPAVIGVDELCSIAAMERGALSEQFKGCTDSELTRQVWTKTLEEVSSGALVGPIPLGDIAQDTPLSRRFGIQQGSKVRCIDDYSRSSVNSAVQSCESPKPHTLDVFAGMCIEVMSEAACGSHWVGRTFDLVGAYRQCAISPSSKRFAHIVVEKPGASELFAFRMRALPFGAVKSVHSFLRVSHSLWYILVKEFWILATNYFDDFVTLSPANESHPIQTCMHMFFHLLGWSFAESGDKAPDFASVFNALGVTIDVTSLHLNLAKIGNTDSRRRELIECLDVILKNGKLQKAEALRLRGRLQFASGNVFGRIAKSALAAVTAHAYYSKSSTLEDRTVLALTLHRQLLRDGRPRELQPKTGQVWFVQTDACYEESDEKKFAGIGAVLFNVDGKPLKFFSQRLSEDMLKLLNPQCRKTAIFECEFFALACALLLWGDFIGGSAVLYTDNNAVRDALISCNTTNCVARKLLVASLALEYNKQICPWYARVPTDSNLSDGPSRLDPTKVIALGASLQEIDALDCWTQLSALAVTWGG